MALRPSRRARARPFRPECPGDTAARTMIHGILTAYQLRNFREKRKPARSCRTRAHGRRRQAPRRPPYASQRAVTQSPRTTKLTASCRRPPIDPSSRGAPRFLLLSCRCWKAARPVKSEGGHSSPLARRMPGFPGGGPVIRVTSVALASMGRWSADRLSRRAERGSRRMRTRRPGRRSSGAGSRRRTGRRRAGRQGRRRTPAGQGAERRLVMRPEPDHLVTEPADPVEREPERRDTREQAGERRQDRIVDEPGGRNG